MFERFPWDHPALHTPAVWPEGVVRDRWVSVCFRRRFRLDEPLDDARVWVSASQRLELWLDGQRLARGPARSDEDRWHVIAVSLPALSAGEHLLAVRVSHFGERAGMGQMGPPGFLLVCVEGDCPLEIDTSGPWRCVVDASRQPLPRDQAGPDALGGVVGCGESIVGPDTPWGWQQPDCDDGDWPLAGTVAAEAADGWGNLPLGCRLRPDPLGPLAERAERFTRVADAPAEQVGDLAYCIAGRGSATIPPGRRCRLVLDRGELTNAYPRLTVTGGRGATVELTSVEAPRDPATGHKGNRDEIAGKALPGLRDRIAPDGAAGRTYETLWFRSLRYLVIDIETDDDALTLEDVSLLATEFPLARVAGWSGGEDEPAGLGNLLDVCHRSIRLCAHETFFDCPHYEQCQFPGDTRVQALYHYAICDDDRLARKAIDDFHASRRSDGMLVCRWPSRRIQIIPTFALAWVAMLDEFRIWRGDVDFLRPYLPAARGAVEWFLARRRSDGLVGRVEHAPFVDWARGFDQGNAPQDADGGSAWIALHLADACRRLGRLEERVGRGERGDLWQQQAEQLLSAVRAQCWDHGRQLFADTPERSSFSEHTQHQAVLAGAIAGPPAADLLGRASEADDIINPGSFYARHAQLEAARRAGVGGTMLFDRLGGWLSCLEGTGLTTLPESNREIPRSDCHAWSVAPAMALVHNVLGLAPDDDLDGAARLMLMPYLGPLRRAAGALPTPHGPARITLRRTEDGCIDADLDAPVPVRVIGEDRDLPPGRHEFRLPCDE
jgi:hypothetical protein